jgi:Periplasmic copper-binding protein (NosD)
MRRSRRSRGQLAAAAATSLLGLTVAGCGSGGRPSPGPSATATATVVAAPAPSEAAPGTTPPAVPTPAAPPPGASRCPASARTAVSSASGLKSALASARPGETIVLAPGVYTGNFTASRSGTASAPITVCGSRNAVLQGQTIAEGYTFYLDHASWWRVEGFTVQGGQKGVMADGASHDVLDGLYVHGTGDEAIHLRSFSSDDTISHCVVRDTGLLRQSFGEGLYVGSAHKNWCRYSGCQPDRSDGNILIGNNIADTTAENIDIKEGTTGGKIIGNQFNGTGMVESAATGWINVKGNGWLIQGNTGVNSDKNGYQVHQVYPGWGIGNVFTGNRAQVNGPGYGIYVQSKRLQTVVSCDNAVTAAGDGFSTLPCSSA